MNEELNRDFYVNTIGVLDWLYDENKYQKIRFELEKCFHYKFNNNLHNVKGPAIEKFYGDDHLYYINGERISQDEHINQKRFNFLKDII